MGADLSGGLDPEFEQFLVQRPDNPQMRDSATIWVMDQSGDIALPRVTIDAIGDDWDRPWVQVNLVTANGRAFKIWDQAARQAESSSPDRIAAGPLSFVCLDPYRRWHVDFSGELAEMDVEAQRLGSRESRPAPVQFSIEAEMIAPPWLMGGMTAEAARLMRTSVAGALMGGLRYEQLCHVSGFIEVAGRRYSVDGTGMRVRRQGVRQMGAAMGHCQHSAIFPSGRALGMIAFAPLADGSPGFNEGFVIDRDGTKYAARFLQAPWMTQLVSSGEAVPLVLETDLGTLRIESETMMTMFDHHYFEMADTSVLQQGVARYSWDGEETIGLIERCTLRDQLQ